MNLFDYFDFLGDNPAKAIAGHAKNQRPSAIILPKEC
jgi:hypothetical protein